MKILITGTPGSGKTSLVKYALSVNDATFVDADEVKGLCEWREFETGVVVGLVDEMTITSNDDWYKKHGWYWRENRLKELFAEYPELVLCGSSENVADYYPLFDKIMVLQKTEEELLRNLKSPDRANPFGKTTKQRAGFMEWQDYLIKEAEPFEPVFVQTNDIKIAYERILQNLKAFQ